MPYSSIKKHVEDSTNLASELAEILIFGKTMGSGSPTPFVLNKVQRWGLRHLMLCPKCSSQMDEFIRDLAVAEKRQLPSPPFRE